LKLRKTTIIVVAITFLLLILVLSFSLQSVLTDYFKNEEQQLNTVNLQRVVAAFDNNFTILNYLANDWSHRNDTYQFVQDGNIEFIRNNLVAATFQDLDVNFIIIQDHEGNVVYAGSYDLESEKFGSISPDLYNFLKPGESIVDFDSSLENKRGIVMLGGKPLLLVVSPIFTSTMSEPVKGVFILGKFFTETEIQILTQQVQFPIQVDYFLNDVISQDFKLARNFFETTDEVLYSQPLSDSILGGYLLVRDLDHQPAFIIRIEQFRNIAKNAEIIMRYVYLAMITSILVFGTLFFIIIEKIVLSRLLRLNKEVESIANSPQKFQFVTVDQKDEISELSKNVNLMLESLTTTEKEKREVEQQLELIVDSVDDTIFAISKDLNDIRVFGGKPALLGFDELPTKQGYFIYNSLTKDWTTSHIQHAIRALSGEHLVYDWTVNQDGNEVFLQISMSPMFSKSGEISGIVGVARNITQLKKMDSDLRQKFEELSALYFVSQLFLSQKTLCEIENEICNLLLQHFSADYAWIGLISKTSNKIKAIASANIPISQIMVKDFPKEVQNGDLELNRPHIFRLPDLKPGKSEKVKYHVLFPLKWEGSPVMLLGYLSLEDPNKNLSSLDFFSSFCSLTELVLANTMLFEEVRVSKRRLQDLSRQLVQVHEEERRWLARELHDEIGQQLTALKLQLEQISISKDKKNHHISMSQKLINELIQKIRQISLDLRPSLLDDLGLLSAFDWFFDRYKTQTGIEVLFTHAGLQMKRFTSDLEITAFRVVQEALTNVARYAKTSSVSIDINVNAKEMMISIEDRGIGFDMDSDWINKSSGIIGMMERVNLINGKFEINSSPGNGTNIYLILPIIMEH